MPSDAYKGFKQCFSAIVFARVNIINVVSSSFAQDKPRQEVDATPWNSPGGSVLFYMVKIVNFGR